MSESLSKERLHLRLCTPGIMSVDISAVIDCDDLHLCVCSFLVSSPLTFMCAFTLLTVLFTRNCTWSPGTVGEGSYVCGVD